jgi:hypothetical protein
MKARTLSVISLLICFALGITVSGQQKPAADPLSGTWSGDWGPNEKDRNRVSVDLKFDGKALTGTVKSTQPARPDVALSNSSFDAASSTVKMEAQAQGRGGVVKYVIEGKLSGNTMTGSWSHDGRKGDFRLTKS